MEWEKEKEQLWKRFQALENRADREEKDKRRNNILIKGTQLQGSGAVFKKGITSGSLGSRSIRTAHTGE